MRTTLLALLLAGLAAGASHAQTSPIPDRTVPAFGGNRDIQIASPPGGPSGTGSAVGSNVGAGATAAPTAEVVTPSGAPAASGGINPPAGTSGSVTITK